MRLILEKQKIWKFHEASVQNVFNAHLDHLFVIWQVLSLAVKKLNLEGFFQNHKMTKS